MFVQSFVKKVILPQEELEREGIWDFDRLSRPYIKGEFLQVAMLRIYLVILKTISNSDTLKYINRFLFLG